MNFPRWGEFLRCVGCGAEISRGSWCNPCRERQAERIIAGRFLSFALAWERAGAEIDECECGRPKPFKAPSCARCRAMEIEMYQGE